MKPRLTALITNYNYGRYLPVAIEAMVRQSRPADELILIDDASTDGSQQVVDELGRRYPFITIIKHEVNRGMNPSGQEGLELATGDYFYWGSADDMVLPGFFATAMALAEKFPDAPLCAGIPVRLHEDTRKQDRTCIGMPDTADFLPPAALWRLAPAGALELGGAWAIFRKRDLKALGGFRVPLTSLSDWFLVYALALGRGLCWTAQPAAVMRLHAQNYSSSFDANRDTHGKVLTHLAELLAGEVPEETRHGFRRSGVLAQLGSPMARVLLSQRRFWRLSSGRFWRARLASMSYHAVARLARRLGWSAHGPRAGSGQKVCATTFDLSAMNAPGPVERNEAVRRVPGERDCDHPASAQR